MPPSPDGPTVHVAIEGPAAPLSRVGAARVVEAVLEAERVRNALVSVTFVTNRAIAAINRKHLDHGGATDVISFGFDRPTRRDPVVGDIYIAPDVARVNARSRGVPLREELIRLLVHGTLHVLGHEHPEAQGRERSTMWRKQERLVASIAKARR